MYRLRISFQSIKVNVQVVTMFFFEIVTNIQVVLQYCTNEGTTAIYASKWTSCVIYAACDLQFCLYFHHHLGQDPCHMTRCFTDQVNLLCRNLAEYPAVEFVGMPFHDLGS